MKRQNKIPFVCASWRHIVSENACDVISQGKVCDACGRSLKETLEYHDVIDIYEGLVMDQYTVDEAIWELRRRLLIETASYHKMLRRSPSNALQHRVNADFISLLLHAT